MRWNKSDKNYFQRNYFNSGNSVTSQWQYDVNVSKLYLAYRWSIALLTLAVAMSSIVLPKPGQALGDASWIDTCKWFIYATHWSYLIIVLQALLGLFLVQKAALNRAQDKAIIDTDRLFEEIARNVSAAAEVNDLPQDVNPPSRVPFLLYRISFAAAFDMALAVTTMFWAFIYEPNDQPFDVINFLMHAANSLLMLVEATLVRHAVLWRDALAPVTIGVVFVAFSVVYQALGGTDHHGNPYIYSVMDWARWQRALGFGAGSVVAMILVHVLLMIFQVLKRAVCRHWILKRAVH